MKFHFYRINTRMWLTYIRTDVIIAEFMGFSSITEINKNNIENNGNVF